MLREGAAQGRLTHDTFMLRMESALVARGHDELGALIADLHREGPLTRWLARVVGAVSSFNRRMSRAWWAERLPQLTLPEAGPWPLVIGRSSICALVLNDDSVSRAHAEVRREGNEWLLRDLGSKNGTKINGWRFVGATPVRPGDLITFGRVSFRITVRH